MNTRDWITVSLTAVLVLTTVYYAWQNRRMVAEMAAARAVSVLPKLAVEWHRLGPTVSLVKVMNVGPGPALDVDVEVVFIPKDGRTPSGRERRRWTSNVMAPGQQAEFLPPTVGGDELPDTEQMANTYERIELSGRLSDALGNRHRVEDALNDIAAWRMLRRDARVRWQEPDAERRLVDALGKRFERPLTDGAQALGEIARRLHEIGGDGSDQLG